MTDETLVSIITATDSSSIRHEVRFASPISVTLNGQAVDIADATNLPCDVAEIKFMCAGKLIILPSRNPVAVFHALVAGALEYGQPFIGFAIAHARRAPEDWAPLYTSSYLGTWASSDAFVADILDGLGEIELSSGSADLDVASKDEILSTFTAIEVTDRVWMFDMPGASAGSRWHGDRDPS
jgi:hypothetical protein